MRGPTPPEAKRQPDGKWLPGGSGNPGGVNHKLRAVQQMLDKNHRNLENMTETYRLLKEACHTELREGKNEGFTKLYLERIQGPVKDLEESRQPEDMTDEEIEAALKEGN